MILEPIPSAAHALAELRDAGYIAIVATRGPYVEIDVLASAGPDRATASLSPAARAALFILLREAAGKRHPGGVV